ncbi:MAG: hypothetical protein AB8F95_14260 [Bacteroidia bacterium]
MLRKRTLLLIIYLWGCAVEAQDEITLKNEITEIQHVECITNHFGNTLCLSTGNNIIQYHLLDKTDSVIDEKKIISSYSGGSTSEATGYKDYLLAGQKKIGHLRIKLGGPFFTPTGLGFLNVPNPDSGTVKRINVNLFPQGKAQKRRLLGFHAKDSIFYLVWINEKGKSLRISSVDIWGRVNQRVYNSAASPDIPPPFSTKNFRYEMELKYYKSSNSSEGNNPLNGFNDANMFIVKNKLLLVRENIKVKNKRFPRQTEIIFVDLKNGKKFDFFYVPVNGKTYVTENSFWFYQRKDKHSDYTYLRRYNLSSFITSFGTNEPAFSKVFTDLLSNQFPLPHSTANKYKYLKKRYFLQQKLDSKDFNKVLYNVLAPPSSAPFLIVRSEGNKEVISFGSIQSNNVYLVNPNASLNRGPKTGKWIWNMNISFDLRKNNFVPIEPTYSTIWEKNQVNNFGYTKPNKNTQARISSIFNKRDKWFTISSHIGSDSLIIREMSF